MKNKSKTDNHLDDKKVSVVIPTHKRPKLVRRAIAGVLKQKHSAHIEIIVVVDNDEPDFSLEMNSKTHSIVVTTNTHTQGLAGARNSGIDKASFQWIAFCDDDDEWLPGKLEAQFLALEKNPEARAATTGAYIRFKGKDTLRVPVQSRLTFQGFLKDRMPEVTPAAWLIHKETLDKIGHVDEEIPGGYAEDYDLMLRTARDHQIVVADDPLVRIWWHGSSFFFERWQTVYDALNYFLEKFPEFETEPEGLARIKGQQAVALAAIKQRRKALKLVRETLKLNNKEKRAYLAIAVCGGLNANKVLSFAHRFGKGI